MVVAAKKSNLSTSLLSDDCRGGSEKGCIGDMGSFRVGSAEDSVHGLPKVVLLSGGEPEKSPDFGDLKGSKGVAVGLSLGTSSLVRSCLAGLADLGQYCILP